MNLDLTGRRAVVGGSTRGIGLAAAEALADLGAEVVLLARDEEAMERIASELPHPRGQSHAHVQADHADASSVQAAAERVIEREGPVHILVHNTGGPPAGRAIDAAPDAYRRAFEMHVVSGQILMRAFVGGMRDARYGRLINVISTSVKEPIPNLGVSNTIRGAVASWAKTLSRELGADGITVNNVLPGFTQTDRLDALIKGRAEKQGVSREQVAEEMRAGVPLGRFAEAGELGAAIAFLASPAASYITGINLPVEGGRLGSL